VVADDDDLGDEVRLGSTKFLVSVILVESGDVADPGGAGSGEVSLDTVDDDSSWRRSLTTRKVAWTTAKTKTRVMA